MSGKKFKFYTPNNINDPDSKRMTLDIFGTTKVPIVGDKYGSEFIKWFTLYDHENKNADLSYITSTEGRANRLDVENNPFSGTPVYPGFTKYTYYERPKLITNNPVVMLNYLDNHKNILEVINNQNNKLDTTYYKTNNYLEDNLRFNADKINDYLNNFEKIVDEEEIEKIKKIFYNK